MSVIHPYTHEHFIPDEIRCGLFPVPKDAIPHPKSSEESDEWIRERFRHWTGAVRVGAQHDTAHGFGGPHINPYEEHPKAVSATDHDDEPAPRVAWLVEGECGESDPNPDCRKFGFFTIGIFYSREDAIHAMRILNLMHSAFKVDK